jgi:predicted metal-dependent peptidase
VFGGGQGAGQAGKSDSDRIDGEKAGDVLGDRQERDWFPDESDEQAKRSKSMQELAAKGLALAKAMGAMRGRGDDSGASDQVVSALRGLYRTPWEMGLQKWLESVAPGERTFTRPSRRGADRDDMVLPGRRRESWMLNVVLDTSGSMTDEIPRALGAIADFCDAVAVDEIRLVQCDAAVTSDETLSPGELAAYRVSGFGGSDLTPAMLALADDARVSAAIVVTDGEIAFPAEPMPYDVLWVLPERGNPGFRPPYGHVIAMQDGGRP